MTASLIVLDIQYMLAINNKSVPCLLGLGLYRTALFAVHRPVPPAAIRHGFGFCCKKERRRTNDAMSSSKKEPPRLGWCTERRY